MALIDHGDMPLKFRTVNLYELALACIFPGAPTVQLEQEDVNIVLEVQDHSLMCPTDRRNDNG
jgi:hypothetical protein